MRTDGTTQKAIAGRTGHALAKARDGKLVVIVVDRLVDVRPMLEMMDAARKPGEIVRRSNGREGFEHVDGGRVIFRSTPDSLRGLSNVDVFLVDPRVATTTELEQAMAQACLCLPSRTGTIVRPGDRLTIGGHVR